MTGGGNVFALPVGFRRGLRRRRLRLGRLFHGEALPQQEVLQRQGEAVQEVPTVGDLFGLGGARRDAPGVDEGTVSGHHLHAGVLFEPLLQGLGGAIGQKVHHAAALQVDQDRAVGIALLEGEVVDAQHPHDLGVG